MDLATCSIFGDAEIISFFWREKKNKNPLPCETGRYSLWLFTGRGLGNYTDLFLLLFLKMASSSCNCRTR